MREHEGQPGHPAGPHKNLSHTGEERGDGLAHIIHDGSTRKRGVAQRDGRVEPRRTEAYLKAR